MKKAFNSLNLPLKCGSDFISKLFFIFVFSIESLSSICFLDFFYFIHNISSKCSSFVVKLLKLVCCDHRLYFFLGCPKFRNVATLSFHIRSSAEHSWLNSWNLRFSARNIAHAHLVVHSSESTILQSKFSLFNLVRVFYFFVESLTDALAKCINTLARFTLHSHGTGGLTCLRLGVANSLVVSFWVVSLYWSVSSC